MPSVHFSGARRACVTAFCLAFLACLARADEAPVPVPAKTVAEPAWEGAIGLTVRNRPDYSGSTSRSTALTPGFFLRHGRFTLTNASGFATRRAEDVERGLAADLVDTADWRVNLALRFDAGRADGGSQFPALDSVKRTLRARALARRTLNEHWQFSLALSPDLLGRGGGGTADLGLSRDQRFGKVWTWGNSLSLTAADRTFLRSYYGVDEAHAAASGLSPYRPGNGLREATVSTALRWDAGGDWVVFGSMTAARLLGAARASPIVTQPASVSASVSAAWRF